MTKKAPLRLPMNQVLLSHPLVRSCDRDDRRPGIFGHWSFILAPDRPGGPDGWIESKSFDTRSRYEVPAASFPKPMPRALGHSYRLRTFFSRCLSGYDGGLLMMMFMARGLEFCLTIIFPDPGLAEEASWGQDYLADRRPGLAQHEKEKWFSHYLWADDASSYPQ